MYRRKSVLLLSIFLIVALSACNLPSGAPEGTPTPDLVLTVTALAAGGAGQQGGSADTPGAPAGAQETATPQFTATPELTATPSIPQVTVSIDTNCRTGPGVIYDIIGALLVGQTGTVVGKNSQTGYWIINNPGKTGTCWLFPQYATVSGNTANLQEYSIPPTPTPTATPTATLTPTPSIPAPINNPTVVKNCLLVNPAPQTFLYQGVLNWEDQSNNETGFNIYRNGALLTNVPANTTTYNLPPFGPFPIGVPVQYGVESFNTAGKAAIKIVVMTCP